MADRRRVNGPAALTQAPVFAGTANPPFPRERPPNGIRGSCPQNITLPS
jgi:hypothetical protein